MSDWDTIEATREGWALLANYARIIAMLPLEDWLEAINRCDTVAPILDPTAYRDGSKRMHEIADLIRAAMPLKKYVMSMQPKEVAPHA